MALGSKCLGFGTRLQLKSRVRAALVLCAVAGLVDLGFGVPYFNTFFLKEPL